MGPPSRKPAWKLLKFLKLSFLLSGLKPTKLWFLPNPYRDPSKLFVPLFVIAFIPPPVNPP
jgi:hypothetical protein